ncbi:Angiopoietin-4 [Mytilus edulis]|uniref:Angiopoietin-4 n=1 Tax=Mytilus edulis TaxID=6550 RepID=A0A8S3TUL3_MYTED|nr:Angiopoietin-4 [Mytilus edulis]
MLVNNTYICFPPLNLTGQRFSTRDRDNDDNAGGQCALTQKGGWWYKWCTYANPNGLYFLGTEPGNSDDTMLFSNQPLYLSGQRFSTKDRDNDGDSNGQCALTQKDGCFEIISQKFIKTKNKGIVSSDASKRTSKARSGIECSAVCTSDENCCSSSFDTHSKICTLFSTCCLMTEDAEGYSITKKTPEQGTFPADCSEFPDGTNDGVYAISVNNDCIHVYCDMVDKWTVIQRRQDGSTDFYRDWLDYKNGFGDPSGEFWLGNDNISNILNGKSYSLRFDLEDWSGERRYAQYAMFSIANEFADYQLTLAGYSGDADTPEVSPL